MFGKFWHIFFFLCIILHILHMVNHWARLDYQLGKVAKTYLVADNFCNFLKRTVTST